MGSNGREEDIACSLKPTENIHCLIKENLSLILARMILTMTTAVERKVYGNYYKRIWVSFHEDY